MDGLEKRKDDLKTLLIVYIDIYISFGARAAAAAVGPADANDVRQTLHHREPFEMFEIAELPYFFFFSLSFDSASLYVLIHLSYFLIQKKDGQKSLNKSTRRRRHCPPGMRASVVHQRRPAFYFG